MRCLRRSLQRWNAEDVGTIHSRCPDQFNTIPQIRHLLTAAQCELHDIDHFPIAVLAGVETVSLETAVSLLLDSQPNAGAGLFQGA